MLLRLESRKMRCRVTLKRLRRKGVSTFKASHSPTVTIKSNGEEEWWHRDAFHA